MVISRTTFKLIGFFLFAHFIMNAQMVGTDGYIVGDFVEIGIDGSGGFEGIETTISPPPAGTHMRTNSTRFGFVANPANDNWATQDGDFFTPGSPENGWGIQIGYSTYGNNVMSSSSAGSEQNDIPGSIVDWTQKGDCISVTWVGMTSGGVVVSVNYFLDITQVFYTTTINITNNTGALIPEMYYYRTLDPDNNQSVSGEYSTMNEVEEQPGAGSCKVALVKASQSSPNNSYLGLAAIGDDWRAGYGGFSNRNGSYMWNGIGFTQTVNVPVDADAAIYISNKISNLALGASKELKFVTILKAADARAAIDGLIKLKYPGSMASIIGGSCNAVEDTVRLCIGSTSTLKVEGATTNSYTWAWSPSSGLSTTVGTDVDITTPTTNVSYSVVGTPSNPCVSDDVVVNFKVIPSLSSSAIVPDDIVVCNGDEVPLTSFTSNPSGGIFTWTNSNTFIGLSAFGSGSVPKFVAKNPTGNPIIATITVNSTLPGGCLGPDSTYNIIVNPIQNLIVTDPTSVCSAQTIDLTDAAVTAGSTGGGALTYWTDRIATNSLDTPSAVGVSGTYYIQQGSGDCGDIDSVILYFKPNPEITNTDTVFCQNDSVIKLTTSDPGGSWTGLNDTYGALDASKEEFKIAFPGIFKIKYDIPGTCSGSDTITLEILKSPTISFETIDTLCDDSPVVNISDKVTVAPNSSILTWTGDVGASGKFDSKNKIGDNYIILSANNQGCINADTLKINVPKRAKADIDSVPVFCINDTDPYSLTPVYLGQNGFWTGPGITTGSTFIANLAKDGNHLIKHEIFGKCGDWDTIRINVEIPKKPTINPIGPTCKGYDPLSISATPIGGFWEDLGGGNKYIDSSGSFNPVDSGYFDLVYTVINPCKASDTVSVFVKDVPTTSFSVSPKEGCPPFEVTLIDESADSSIQTLWDFGNNETSIDSADTLTQLYETLGCFDITLTNSYPNGCYSKAKMSEGVCSYNGPYPDFTWSPEVLDIYSNQALFDDLSIGNIAGWRWDFSDVVQPTNSSLATTYKTLEPFSEISENPVVVFNSPSGDVINVKLKVTNIYGCVDSIVKPVKILDKFSVNLPNAFSPNNDGLNDEFFPNGRNIEFGDSYDFRIYNRWGNLIWKSITPFEGWDGRIRELSFSRGRVAEVGIYVWRLIVVDPFTGDNYELSGTVTLMM
jgi:gliding motility-associated-like protein